MKMIFHLPMQLDVDRPSGSQIRPMKMLQAFKNIGYEVDVVMGDVKTRKQQIQQIKENISNGIKYDFVYSESSTMPTALTESHHLPVAPFLDFNFLRFCKKNNIKVGLFYRDIFWKFKKHTKFIENLKYKFSLFFYKSDLKRYEKDIDILYLPSKKMFDYIDMSFDTNKVIDLPPGIELKDIKEDKKTLTDILTFVYVGGLSKLYDLTLFSKTLSTVTNVEFNLCTREKEWQTNKNLYQNYDFLNIYHLSGKELEVIYNRSDIAIYFVKPHFIWEFAMGLKLFEYLSFVKPIIAVEGTSVGTFVKENNVGWTIPFDEEKLKELIEFLQNNPQEIVQKKENIKKIITNHTWDARAKKVSRDLSF